MHDDLSIVVVGGYCLHLLLHRQPSKSEKILINTSELKKTAFCVFHRMTFGTHWTELCNVQTSFFQVHISSENIRFAEYLITEQLLQAEKSNGNENRGI